MFGKFLSKYLEFKKISIYDFSYRLGISYDEMNAILDNDIKLSDELIFNIVFLTKIDIYFIYFLNDKTKFYSLLKLKYKDDNSLSSFLNEFYIKILNSYNLNNKDINIVTIGTVDEFENAIYSLFM